MGEGELSRGSRDSTRQVLLPTRTRECFHPLGASFPSSTWECLFPRSCASSILTTMRSRYQAKQPDVAYFVTSTVVEWLPVFTTAARCDILVEALAYCREHKALRITAWVILDNHFHAILSAPDLPRVMADLKRHTAKQVIAQLQADRCEWLLHLLRTFRAPHKTESEYQFWQEGVSPAGHHQRRNDGAKARLPASQSAEARTGRRTGGLAVFIGARVE